MPWIRVVTLLLVAGIAFASGTGLAALGDMVFERNPEAAGTGAFPPAVFPHWVHRTRFRCYVCHPAIFEMKQGANAVTMDAINKGEFCGACHNGRVAFRPQFESCSRCHRAPEE